MQNNDYSVITPEIFSLAEKCVKNSNIDPVLYTLMFATARIAGWSAHRIEELINTNKIIRPAYIAVSEITDYVPLDNR